MIRAVKNSNTLQILKARCIRPFLHKRGYADRKLNFYFLSTGRVGTRFFSRVLDTATNARVFHQPGPQLKETVVRDVVSKFVSDPDRFADLSIEDYPRLEEKILRQLTQPFEVYGDTLNHMFPFGAMLYRYLGPERLRLVHLIRHPVTCGRSTLMVERDDDPTGGRFKELRPPEFLTGETPAEKTASIWNGVNGMIRTQFEMIDDSRVCRVVRLEDASPESLRELFQFLGLDGFSEEKVFKLMGDSSYSVRHSHIGNLSSDRKDASTEELETIHRLCAPLAEHYDYDQSFDKVLESL